MARSKDSDRSSDAAKLDRAIDAMLTIVEAEPKKSGDDEIDALNAAGVAKGKIEAAKALPGLFARRSAILGLDQVEAKQNATDGGGSLAELERRMALVGSGMGDSKRSS